VSETRTAAADRKRVAYRTGVSPVRVLVIEDHPFHRRLACLLFEAFGCEVWLAGDGDEGVTAADTRLHDLVIMDRHMPRCDGDHATRRIRASGGPSSNALFVCYSTDPPCSESAALYDRIIPKPLTAESALRLLAALVATERPDLSRS